MSYAPHTPRKWFILEGTTLRNVVENDYVVHFGGQSTYGGTAATDGILRQKTLITSSFTNILYK